MLMYFIKAEIDRIGTIESDNAVALCIDFFKIMRNRGTIIMPPPKPLRATIVPAKIPTSMDGQS